MAEAEWTIEQIEELIHEQLTFTDIQILIIRINKEIKSGN
jgi:hypothetical protein